MVIASEIPLPRTDDTNHWCRIVMDQRTRELVQFLDYQGLDTLEISGGRWNGAGFRSYQAKKYPDFYICAKQPQVNPYDLVIAEQVFEHLSDPEAAIHNVHRLLRKGGHFLVTTPVLIKYHPCPNDYWRWLKTE